MTSGFGPSFDPDRLDYISSARGPYQPSPPGRPPARREDPTGFAATKRMWLRAGALISAFIALLYAIEAWDAVDSRDLDMAGIEPREVDGLDGILWAPLLHAGWDHLISNTLPLLILGFLVLATGIWRGLAATGVIWVVAGVGTWLIGGDNSVHVGASSLIFGWLTYLLLRGIFARDVVQIVIGLVVFVLYGSMLWGVLPSDPRISWQGHLFGAVGGVLAAWWLARRPREKRPAGA